MIRAIDSSGALIIGLPRKVLLKLLAGGKLQSEPLEAVDDYPVVRLIGGETDESIMDALREFYGSENVPEHPLDYRAPKAKA